MDVCVMTPIQVLSFMYVQDALSWNQISSDWYILSRMILTLSQLSSVNVLMFCPAHYFQQAELSLCFRSLGLGFVWGFS